jgi:hypothetical protein
MSHKCTGVAASSTLTDLAYCCCKILNLAWENPSTPTPCYPKIKSSLLSDFGVLISQNLRPICSKLKKRSPAAKDAACAVVPDSSFVSSGKKSTVVAKIKENPDAVAAPTVSRGNATLGKPDAAAVTSCSSGNEVTIATTMTLEKTVAVSINKGANVTIGASVEASAPIATTANPSTRTKATAHPSNISKETIAVKATAPTTTNATIIAFDPSVKEVKYISFKRRQFHALHHHNEPTLSPVSSKIQYQNDCYAD